MAKDPQNEIDVKKIGIYISIPFVLAVPPVIGGMIGQGVDSLMGTRPLWTSLMILLGVAAGVRECARIIRKYGDPL